MKKLIFIAITIVVSIFKTDAQTLSESSPEYKVIREFLSKKGKWNKNRPSIIAYGCLIDSLKQKPCGIYSFKQMSSNAEVYIYLKDKKGKIKIIDDYMILYCMKEVNSFFSKNWDCLSHIDAINYSMEIIAILKEKENLNTIRYREDTGK